MSSPTLDETCDIGNIQKLVIYISYFYKKSYSIKFSFFRILEITSKTGKNIFKEFIDILKENGLNIDKMVGIIAVCKIGIGKNRKIFF